MRLGDDVDLIDRLLEGRVKSALFGVDHAPRLGRFVVLEPIGTGAMGAVFLAYDPKLDRKVAVKVLSAGFPQDDLLREARALGKLRHPNVVSVFDAGEVDGAVYLVMELVDGPSLDRWIDSGERDWRRVAGLMAQVADAVAAAHDASLVHGDVKPANILVDGDRAVVVDFGLARIRTAGDSDAIAGTPGYMAPELLAGEGSSPAGDQFALAVTAYEALYGERPHRTKKLSELAAAAADAENAPRRDPSVPRRLHEAITRGLAAAPERRFPSMRAFADALRPARRGRRAIAAAVVMAVAATAVAGVHLASREAPDPCDGGPALLAPTWNDERAAVIAGALGDAPWARRAIDAISTNASRWVASHRSICEATRVYGRQSDSLFDLRMRCLDRQRSALDALLASIAAIEDSADDAPQARVSAATALAALDAPETCASLERGAELARPDERDREAVVRAVVQLDRAASSLALGRYADARAALDRATAALGGADFAPVRARLALLDGAVEARAGDRRRARERLEAAMVAAASVGARRLELDAWLWILRDELFAGSRERVIELAPFARAAAAAVGRSGAEIDGIVGEALRNLGRLDEARAALDRALADAELTGHRRAIVEMNAGTVSLLGGDPIAAEAAFTRARELATAALGADHPSVALYIDKLAAARRERGDTARALELHDRALALRERAYGPDDRSVASALLRRAETRIAAGDARGALPDLDRAAEIRREVFGADHRRLAAIERARAAAYRALGDLARASAHDARATALDPATAPRVETR